MKKKESIFNFYKKIVLEYKEKYRFNKLVVLMQVGSFYEIYDSGDSICADTNDLSSILNIIVTKKDKSKPEVNESNHLLIGFPCISINKYLPKLVDHDYIVVTINQDPVNKTERKVSGVVSKGTYFTDNVLDYKITNWIACIYSEDSNSIGIAFLDLSTGASSVYQFYTELYQECARVLKLFNPCELVVSNNILGEIQAIYNVNLIHTFELQNESVTYKNNVLSKVFTNTGLLTPIEYCNLEYYPECLNAFVGLIQFAYKQNEEIVKYLTPPEIVTDNKFMYCNNNSLDKLNFNLLDKVLNKCKTCIGKREFKKRLLNPLYDELVINTRLNTVDLMASLTDTDIEFIRERLKKVKDILVITRKLMLTGTSNKNLSFFLITNLRDSLQVIQELIGRLQLNTDVDGTDTDLEFRFECVADATSKLLSLINRYFSNCSSITNFSGGLIEWFPCVNNKLTRLYSSIQSPFPVELVNDQIVLLTNCTKLVAAKIKQGVFVAEVSGKSFNLKDFSQSNTKSTIRLTNEDFSKDLSIIVTEINLELNNHFKNFINELISEEVIDTLTNFIAVCDVAQSVCYTKRYFRYTKPRFSNNAFVIKGIRHPVIEQLNKTTKYVENDIDLSDQGILLYGINSIGKSSLIKSIGLNVILAQAGMYVACEDYSCSLIDKIFTRLPGSDDILSNNSSFTIEMAEIRDIILNATKNSLILGDEICQSTETFSGISIITSALMHFSKEKIKFVISSHLHELTESEFIRNLDFVKIKHLSISSGGNGTKEIIFDRKLKDGPFTSLYGLEICKTLRLPDEFIKNAEVVRKDLIKFKELGSEKKSRYNNDFFVSQFCEVCLSKNGQRHVHHILPQNLADTDGFIGRVHKNDKFNLVTLCEECHHSVHSNKLIINGYILTSDGIKLSCSGGTKST